MEVILLEQVVNLGGAGDKVTIKSGYARNYLVPQGKAVFATAEKIKEFEVRRVELEAVATKKLAAANARADALKQLHIVISQKAGDEGKLFGSVGTQDIADAITKNGINVERQEVRMPDGVIRQTGQYDIAINVHSDVVVTLLIEIVAEA